MWALPLGNISAMFSVSTSPDEFLNVLEYMVKLRLLD